MTEFKANKVMHSSQPEPAEAIGYLLDRYVRAQECAMRTIADMAVVGLDPIVHDTIQQRLVDMVKPRVVSQFLFCVCSVLYLLAESFLFMMYA